MNASLVLAVFFIVVYFFSENLQLPAQERFAFFAAYTGIFQLFEATRDPLLCAATFLAVSTLPLR